MLCFLRSLFAYVARGSMTHDTHKTMYWCPLNVRRNCDNFSSIAWEQALAALAKPSDAQQIFFPVIRNIAGQFFCSWSILGMRESNAGELRTVFYKCTCCRPGYASALHPVKMKVTEHVVLTRKEVHFTTLCGAGLSLGRIATAVWKHKVHMSSL